MGQRESASSAEVVAKNLRHLRTKRDWSQYQLAAAAKVSRATVAAIEGMRYGGLRSTTLDALAGALGCEVAALTRKPRRGKGARG